MVTEKKMKINLRKDRRSNIFERKQLIVKSTSYGGKNVLVDELITPVKLRRASLLERTAAIKTNTLNARLNQTWSKIKSASQSLISRKQLINWDVLKISNDNDQELATTDKLTSNEQDSSMIRNVINEVFNSPLLDSTLVFDNSVVQVAKCNSIVPDTIITRSISKKLLASNCKFLPDPPSANLEIKSKPKPTINNLERLFSPRRLRSRILQQKPNEDVKPACVPVPTKRVPRRKRSECDSNESTTSLSGQKRVKRPNKETIEENNNVVVLRRAPRLIERVNSIIDNNTNTAKIVLTPLSLPPKVVKEVPKRKQKPRQKKESVKENTNQFPISNSIGVNFLKTKSQKSENLEGKDNKIINSKDDGNTLLKVKRSSKEKALKVPKQRAKKLIKKSSDITSKKNAFENLEEEKIVGKKIVFPVTARKGTLKHKMALRQYLDEVSKEDDDQDYFGTPFRKNSFKLGNLKINDEVLNYDDNVMWTPHSVCSLPSPGTIIKTPNNRDFFSPGNIPNKRKMADLFMLQLKRRAKPKIKKAGIKKKKNPQLNLDKIINKQVREIKRQEEFEGFWDDDDQELSNNEDS